MKAVVYKEIKEPKIRYGSYMKLDTVMKAYDLTPEEILTLIMVKKVPVYIVDPRISEWRMFSTDIENVLKARKINPTPEEALEIVKQLQSLKT